MIGDERWLKDIVAESEVLMTYVIWSSDFSVGVPALDGQHLALLELCKQAAACLENDGDDDGADIRNILERLVSYTDNHFREEERLLRECNYPHLIDHHAEHVEYTSRLNEFLVDAANGVIDKESLFDYLADWWGNHILGADKAYMPFLGNKTQKIC